MEGIVLELEREALDENVSIEVLLRKAYLVARKLKLTDFEEWINNEQNGYVGKVPEYRMIGGEYKALNPYRGWIPVILPADVAKVIAKAPLRNSISSLRDVYNTSEGSISFSVGAEIEELLNNSFFPIYFHCLYLSTTYKRYALQVLSLGCSPLSFLSGGSPAIL